MQKSSGTTPVETVPPNEVGDCFVLCRTADGWFWGGTEWVPGWERALQFHGYGYEPAEELRLKLKTAGYSSAVFFIHPQLTPRTRPRPTRKKKRKDSA